MSSKIRDQPVRRIGMVGAGNMGSMMTLGLSELGVDVSVWDIKRENIKTLVGQSKKVNGAGKVDGFHDIRDFVSSLERVGDRKLLLFSITHGYPADSVLDMIKDQLKQGDIILDGGNENYRRTEKRQKECAEIGVSWIGMGVSGGYQSARHGPSLSPSGDSKALELVMPLLEGFAAKDPKSGQPCVAPIGPAGSGHFVKSVHNGIEVGMLSTIAEAWSLLCRGLGMNYDEIGNLFKEWNSEGELRNTYLLNIAVDMLHTKRTKSQDQKGGGASNEGEYVLDDVLDKVVQDDDGTEGTPTWCIMESAARHIATPTLAAGFYLRVASGNRNERLSVAQNLQVPGPKPLEILRDRASFLDNLRLAVYCSFLASFCQGLELISRASEEEGWNIDLRKCLQVWRAGCIIQSEGISDLIQPALPRGIQLTNMKLIQELAHELHENFNSLKEVVMKGTLANHYLPAMSATLECLKYQGGTMLPTQFMEGQLDFFGSHAYDMPNVPGEDPGSVGKGAHHYEWRPA